MSTVLDAAANAVFSERGRANDFPTVALSRVGNLLIID
jgi:hypothetical protein